RRVLFRSREHGAHDGIELPFAIQLDEGAPVATAVLELGASVQGDVVQAHVLAAWPQLQREQPELARQDGACSLLERARSAERNQRPPALEALEGTREVAPADGIVNARDAGRLETGELRDEVGRPIVDRNAAVALHPLVLARRRRSIR